MTFNLWPDDFIREYSGHQPNKQKTNGDDEAAQNQHNRMRSKWKSLLVVK